jgi:hypothetical protein
MHHTARQPWHEHVHGQDGIECVNDQPASGFLGPVGLEFPYKSFEVLVQLEQQRRT